MKANVNIMKVEAKNTDKRLFTIIDSNGRYVSKYSIWYEKEIDTWHYTSKGGYEVDNSKKNLDTGVILNNSIEDAERVIEMLKANLHKVSDSLNLTFTVVPVSD